MGQIKLRTQQKTSALGKPDGDLLIARTDRRATDTTYHQPKWQYPAGARDTSRYVPVHDLAYKIVRGLCQVLPALHILTGCDYTSKFGTKHAALKANPEKYLLQFGTISDIDRQVVVAEEYLVQVFKKSQTCRSLDQLRCHLYHHAKRPCLWFTAYQQCNETAHKKGVLWWSMSWERQKTISLIHVSTDLRSWMTYLSHKKKRIQCRRSILSGAIVPNVLLSAAPVEKTPALHLILKLSPL